MRFGTYFFLQAPPGRTDAEILTEELDQMVLAEELGFDSVWLTEHHYADYGLSSAPSVLLATGAARTSRISLGIAVYVIPFHHPLRLAEETASIDILSGGRLTVGLGNVPVHPKPLQKPHPPLAFAVTSPETIAWTAQHGYGMLSSGLGTPLPQTIKNRDAYVSGLRSAGYAEADVARLLNRWVVTKHVYVAPTDAEARTEAHGPEMWYREAFVRSLSADGLVGLHESVYQGASAMIQRLRSQTWEDLLNSALLIGSPETVALKMAELQSAGAGEVACWMNFGGLAPDKVRRSMRLFAEEVMPRFQDSTPCSAVSYKRL